MIQILPIHYKYDIKSLFHMATMNSRGKISYRQYSDSTMQLAMMLKPMPLVLRKKGDSEQLFKDWEDYLRVFNEFLEATGVVGDHADPEISNRLCAACIKAKNMLRLVGGDEVRYLFDHVGMVEDTDRWQQSLEKVSEGIKSQRRLQARKPSSSGFCQTCTRPTHASGECPGKRVECFTCGLVGHFKGSAVCKGKKAAGGKKKNGNAHQVDDMTEVTNEHSDTDRIGRVVEIVRAAGDNVKNKTADIQMTVLDHGQPARELTVEFLIDSGVYRTLLTEEQWQRVQADKNNRKPTLKRNRVKLVPYGTSQGLTVLGRSKCMLTAKALSLIHI